MSARRRYHTHIPGVIFVIATLILGVGAYNSQNNLLFLFFGIAIASMVASGVISGAMLMNLHAERPRVRRVEAGDSATIRYRVTNASRFAPAFALMIEESGAAEWRRIVEPPSAFMPHVPPGGTSVASARARTNKRGVAKLTGVTITSRFPFGFMRKSISTECPGELIVHPRVHELRRDALKAVADSSRGEAILDHERGVGGDFYALREYTSGDPPNRIAWRASARHDDLLVREETRIGASACDLLLVLDETDAGEDSNERAIELVASLADHAVRTNAPVSLTIAGRDTRLGRGASPEHLGRILDQLSRLELSDRPTSNAQSPSPAPGGRAIAVHASGIDPSRAPSGAVHLRAEDLDRLAIGDTKRAHADRSEAPA